MPENPIHACGNCQRYTAVVDGWAMNLAQDGYTVTAVRHSCGESLAEAVQ